MTLKDTLWFYSKNLLIENMLCKVLEFEMFVDSNQINEL